MLQSILKPRATSFLLIQRIVPYIQSKALPYKTHIRQLYNDGIDLKQQPVEINPIERIRRCIFYKATCPNVRTLADALNEGCIASNDGPCVVLFQSSTDLLQWISYSKVMEQSRLLHWFLFIDKN